MRTGSFLRMFLIDIVRLLFHSSDLLKKHGDLRVEDLPHLFPEDQTANMHAKYEGYLKEEIAACDAAKIEVSSFRMFKVFFKTFHSKILIVLLHVVLMTVFKLASSVLVRNLIDALSNQRDDNKLYMWAGLIAVTYIFQVAFMHHANKIVYNFFS